jgi:hypothetical protein
LAAVADHGDALAVKRFGVGVGFEEHFCHSKSPQFCID